MGEISALGNRRAARGQMTLQYQGRQLAYTHYQQQSRQADVVPSKQIAAAVEAAQRKPSVMIPAGNHPWRNYPKRQTQTELPGRGAAPEGEAAPRAEPDPQGTFLLWVDKLRIGLDLVAHLPIISYMTYSLRLLTGTGKTVKVP